MSGLGPVMLMVLVAANPAGGALSVAWRPSNREQWRPRVVLALAAALGALWALAAMSGPILDGLSVTVGTWRLATSVPLAVAGLRWMLWPARPIHDEPRAGVQMALIALTVLFTPQLVAVVVATAAHDGTARTMAGVVAAGVVTAALLWFRAVPTPLLSVVARLLGGIAVVLAIALGVDGTQTI
ncbi:hypothetical protein [Candidatus Poriferisocius sp.]|uniref:hypothetical protein n=1 Tax=Candidatus Poriferisocius sp. TaxID=3101276 RepID=UPI003B5CFB30